MWHAVGSFFEHLVSPTNPVWLFYPLLAVVAVVYKATKLDDPKRIALSALHFFVTVSVGMFVLGLAVYVVSRLV